MGRILIDINKCPKTIDTINAILNVDGIAEVKREYNTKTNSYNLTVVEVHRSLKSVLPDNRRE